MSTVIKGSASGQINLNDTTGSIQLNGSDVLTIDSSGNLTAPNNLTVNGNLVTDTNTFYVDATNNRVGIGTSSPTEGQLVVRNDSGDAKLNIKVNSFDGTNGVAALDFSTGGQGANDPQARIHALGGNNYSAGIVFSTQQSGTINPLVERMRIDGGTGSIRIGSNNAYGLNEKVMIYGSSTANQPTILSSKEASGTASSNHFLFQNTNGTVGSIATASSSTSFNTSSDYRLKENVIPMSGSIDRLKQLKPSTWSWVQDGSHGEGFVAHEAQLVVPEAVTGTKDEVDDENNPVYQGIDQSKLVPLLTAALQEAITKIEDLETRIQALESA